MFYSRRAVVSTYVKQLYYIVFVTNKVVLPCGAPVLQLHVALYEPDIPHHQTQKSEVSIFIQRGVCTVQHNSTCLTTLWCNTSVKCFAPSALILLSKRWIVVSVCIDWERCIYNSPKLQRSYLVVQQCLSNMLCPLSTNIVVLKVESSECLYESIPEYIQFTKLPVVLPCCGTVLEPYVVLLQHQYYSAQDWDWWVPIWINSGVHTAL